MPSRFRSLVLAVAFSLPLAATAVAEEVKSVFNGADPAAMFVNGELWVDPTDTGERLSAWSSTDMIKWTKRGDLLTQKDIHWIKDDRSPRHDLWAPDMVPANGRYYLYYSVGPQDPTPSRLGVATCDKPEGPCVDSGKPLLTGGNGFEAIDPTVFVDAKSGKRYLYTGGSNGHTLRVFELTADMVTIDHEVKIDQPPAYTEAPFMHERNGIYYLSYSSGHWNTGDYHIDYAMAPSPIGPWKYRGTLLKSDKRYRGPGHHTFLQDPRDGSWLIVYHRWEGKHDDGPYKDDNRRVVIQHIAYDPLGQIEPISMSDK
jgi:beta-xylosidase